MRVSGLIPKSYLFHKVICVCVCACQFFPLKCFVLINYQSFVKLSIFLACFYVNFRISFCSYFYFKMETKTHTTKNPISCCSLKWESLLSKEGSLVFDLFSTKNLLVNVLINSLKDLNNCSFFVLFF